MNDGGGDDDDYYDDGDDDDDCGDDNDDDDDDDAGWPLLLETPGIQFTTWKKVLENANTSRKLLEVICTKYSWHMIA